MADMTIATLARAGGVGVETVRYYQRLGLMPEPPRPVGGGSRGGVRRYDDDAARRLRFIKAAQTAGFTLQEVGELLALDATGDRARVHALAQGRIAALDARITALTEARGALARLSRQCEASADGPCPILGAFEAAS